MGMKGGLLAEVMKVVAWLDHFADTDVVPLVYFNQPRFLYWGDEGWRGARNGWEYYFHALSEQRLEDLVPIAPEDLELMTPEQIADHCREEVALADRFLMERLDPLGDVPTEHRHRFVALWAKHVRVREEVLRQVDDFARERFGKARVIGIHYRLTDKLSEVRQRLELAGRDPGIIDQCDLDRYLDEALAVADPDSLFFFATEDESYLERARARLGDRLIATNATRTRSGAPAFLTEGSPKLGEEALIDCLLLSRCDYLVHGQSFLAFAAGLFNPALPRTNVLAKLAGLEQPVLTGAAAD
jgi:hypothetical protein